VNKHGKCTRLELEHNSVTQTAGGESLLSNERVLFIVYSSETAYAICAVFFFFFPFQDLLLQYVSAYLQSCNNPVVVAQAVAVKSSEELSFVRLNSGVFYNRLVLLLVKCTRTGNSSCRGSIKSIESVAHDFRHNEEVGNAKTAGSKGP
jgi:hypothetical protein